MYFISFLLFLITISGSVLLGRIIIRLFKLNLPVSLYFPIGLFTVLGIGNILVYPIIYFQLAKWWLYLFYIVLLCLPFITLFRFKSIQRKYLLYFSLLIFYVLLMAYFSSRNALGEISFDTVHYLSLVQENSIESFFNLSYVDNGNIKNFINPIDDYQSYYYFASMFVWLVETLLQKIGSTILPLTTGVYIWIFSCLLYALNFSLVYSVLDYLKLKSRLLTLGIGIFVLLFIGNIYYYNNFAFYGNSFRTTIVSFIMFLIYRQLNEKLQLSSYSILIMLMSSALIGASSSGYFIGLFGLYAFVAVINEQKQLIGNYRALIFLTLPTVLFVIFNFNQFIVHLLFITIFAYISFVLNDLVQNRTLNLVLFWIIRLLVFAIIPLFIWFISFQLLRGGYQDLSYFFREFSTGDMIWDYFTFRSWVHVIVNTLYLTGLVSFILLGKSIYRWILLVIILTFINPVSIMLVHRYFAGLVTYRSFEIVFNHFSIILFLSSLYYVFKKIKKGRFYSVAILVISCVLTYNQVTTYYNPLFIPSENMNSWEKLTQDEVDTFKFLKTKIYTEQLYRPTVVSQIHSIKGFVPNIIVPITFNQMRTIDRYSNSANAPTPLHNIFVYREYSAQQIYNTEPDYRNTCKYLADAKVDFVIIAHNQVFIEDGEYVPLFVRMRSCGDLEYSNEGYAIFRLNTDNK